MIDQKPSEYIVETINLFKNFGGSQALQNVSYKLGKGEIHGLVGQNGAGKSTLVKIISGIIPQSSGELFIEGEKVLENSPSIAMNKYGIATVLQNIEVHYGMTVMENLYINDLPFKFGFVNYKKMFKDTIKWFEKFSLDVNPTTLVEDTSFVQKRVIFIIKALREDKKIIILDEPTASLHIQEIELLFKYIKEFNKSGITFIYISHHLEEIFQICDKVTILKDGEITAVKNVKETNKNEIISLMLKKKNLEFIKSKSKLYSYNVLQIKNLSDKKRLKNISFDLKKGEIISIVGIKGCGKEELVDCLFGIKKKISGQVILNGKEITKVFPNISLGHGISLLPNDRKELYLFLDKSIKENISFSNLKKIKGLFGFLNLNKEEKLANNFQKIFEIKARSMKQSIKDLSGGNQQKVAFSKAINSDPKVLILHEPTVGIDVGTRLDIHKLIIDLSKQGISIILVSADIEEVLRLSDRVIVMYKGELIKTINREDKEFNEKEIILYVEGARD